MNGSIISLIQEKRKLFYTGVIRNTFKDNDLKPDYQGINFGDSGENENKENRNFKSRSIQILQEIFSE